MAKCVDCGVEVPEFRERCNDCLAQANLREMAEEERSRRKAIRARGEDASRGHVNTAIIFLNFAVFAAMTVKGVSPMDGPRGEEALRWGANHAYETLSGEWWRLISAMFMHYGIMHIGMNMYALWQIGAIAEEFLGPTIYAFVYLLTGIAGFMVSMAWHPQSLSAGASAPICGIVGAVLALLWFHYVPIMENMRKGLVSALAQSLIITLAIGMFFNIDNAAHLGGAVFGFLLGSLLCLLKRQSLEIRLAAVIASSVLLVAGYSGVEKLYGAQVAMEHAIQAQRDHKFAAVERYAQQAISHGYSGRDAYALLAFAQVQQKRPADAEQTLKKILARDANDAWALATLGEIYLDEGKLGEAKAVLERSASLEDNSPYSHIELGRAYYMLHDLSAAESQYRRTLELNADEETAYYGLGLILRDKGDLPGARDAFKRALEIEKNYPEAEKALAEVTEKLKAAKP